MGNNPVNYVDPSWMYILWGLIPTTSNEASAFGQSVSDSVGSITSGLAGTYMTAAPSSIGGNTQAGQQLQNEAYDQGPYGQTADGPAWAYYGTRGAFATATVATGAVVVVGLGPPVAAAGGSVLRAGATVAANAAPRVLALAAATGEFLRQRGQWMLQTGQRCGQAVQQLFNRAPSLTPAVERTVQVTSWAEKGTKPDLNPTRWVQLGGPTWWNYIKTGLWGGKYE
jgi:hypothetical protein